MPAPPDAVTTSTEAKPWEQYANQAPQQGIIDPFKTPNIFQMFDTPPMNEAQCAYFRSRFPGRTADEWVGSPCDPNPATRNALLATEMVKTAEECAAAVARGWNVENFPACASQSANHKPVSRTAANSAAQWNADVAAFYQRHPSLTYRQNTAVMQEKLDAGATAGLTNEQMLNNAFYAARADSRWSSGP